jgi:hypothetical protein
MLRALMSSGSFSGTPSDFICWYFCNHSVSFHNTLAMRLGFATVRTLNNCWTCSLVMPGGNKPCCPMAFWLLPCCGMPWLGCTAAMLSSFLFSQDVLGLFYPHQSRVISRKLSNWYGRTRVYSVNTAVIQSGRTVKGQQRHRERWWAASYRSRKSQARKAQCWLMVEWMREGRGHGVLWREGRRAAQRARGQ